MADFSLFTAIRMMGKTAPFIVFRVIVYGAVAAAYVMATGLGAGMGYGIGGFWGEDARLTGSAYGAIGGFGLTAAALYMLREYLLYTVKAGHIAVLVELVQGRAIPDGQGQIAFARQAVSQRFGTASILFGIDQLVKGVIGAVTGLLEGLLSFLPIPGLDKLVGLLRAYLRVAVGLLDEVMLAYCFQTRAENPYEASKTALVLYAQNARAMLVNAAWVTLWVWILSFLVFLVMLVPAGMAAWFLPTQISAATLVFAVLMAWVVKAALIEPFAVACMLQAYFKLTADQTPDPVWAARLDGASAKFKTLGQRAASWARPNLGAGRFEPHR